MKDRVEKTCTCGHLEIDHKYRHVKSAHELLGNLNKDPRVEIVRDPDSTKILGFKLDENTYMTYDKALAEAEEMRTTRSRCEPNVFDSECGCKVFKTDNLKYLEDLDERSTS